MPPKLPSWHTVFREADGSVSMTRVCLLFATVVILGTWCGLSIAHGQVLDLPTGVVGALGMLCGLKWGQMKHESDGPCSQPEG